MKRSSKKPVRPKMQAIDQRGAAAVTGGDSVLPQLVARIDADGWKMQHNQTRLGSRVSVSLSPRNNVTRHGGRR